MNTTARHDRQVRASWRQTTIHDLVDARPVRCPTDGSPAPAYRVRVASGARLELDADAVCERLSNEHGERIALTVDGAAHVLAAHMRGKRAGAFAAGMTLTRLLELFHRRCHEPLGHGERSHKITVSCARVIGTCGVVSTRELVERGVLSDRDLRQLAYLKQEVLAASLYGSAQDRAALVARANARWRASNVRLTERNGVVLPAFIAAPQPTRSFVIVLDPPRANGPAHDQRRIHTIYPGRPLCDAPRNPGITPQPGIPDQPPDAAISQRQQARDRGKAPTGRERALLRAYEDAFEVWYEHGPLLPAALQPHPRQAKPRKSALSRRASGAA